jgi:hypothetical protein
MAKPAKTIHETALQDINSNLTVHLLILVGICEIPKVHY